MSIILTIKGKTDGFGAQYQAILSGIAFCYKHNYIYYHTPITQMEHDVDIDKANKFIGIKSFEGVNTSNSVIEIPFVREVHYCHTPSIYYTNKVLEYIRKCYYGAPKPDIKIPDIAIHIRRGDVNNYINSERYVNNSIYVKIINKLKEKYPEYSISIFSEGKFEDFKELELEENCFKLNTDIFDSFHMLCESKVLIMGFSSFSYCAGIINNNTVYHYDSFWHKKLDHWLRISDLRLFLID